MRGMDLGTARYARSPVQFRTGIKNAQDLSPGSGSSRVRFYALKTYVRVRASSRSAVRVRVRAETLLDRI